MVTLLILSFVEINEVEYKSLHLCFLDYYVTHETNGFQPATLPSTHSCGRKNCHFSQNSLAQDLSVLSQTDMNHMMSKFILSVISIVPKV